MMRSEHQGLRLKTSHPARWTRIRVTEGSSPVNKPPSPPVSVAPSDLRAGALFTEALVQVAAEHARDREVPESIVVAALSSALGCVAAAIARSNGFDLARYEEFVANHFARVFQAESVRPVYH